MSKGIDYRAREAGRVARQVLAAHRSAIDPTRFDRALARRRRRQGVALAATVPLVVAVAAAVVFSNWTPSSLPQVGRAPTGTAGPTDSPGIVEQSPSSPAVPSPPPVQVTDELPAAPIDPRVGHSVVWTGTHLLVWGGSQRFETPDAMLNDGAAYHHRTGTWQPLPAAPGAGSSGHIAVWSGSTMVVAGGGPAPRTVLRYDPDTGSWMTGADAPFDIHRDRVGAAWTGSTWAVWSPGHGFAEYDPNTDQWSQPPPPPVDAPRTIRSNTQALHAHGDLLYAVAGDVRAPVQVAIRQADGTWIRGDDIGTRSGTMPDGDSFTDFQIAKHTVATAAGLLAVPRSGDAIPAALLDPDTGQWTDLAVPGIPACEDLPAPLPTSDGAVIFNYCGPDAYFDAQTREFTTLQLPDTPAGGDGTTVWTGRSLLTYATGCCYGHGPTVPVMGSWERTIEP